MTGQSLGWPVGKSVTCLSSTSYLVWEALSRCWGQNAGCGWHWELYTTWADLSWWPWGTSVLLSYIEETASDRWQALPKVTKAAGGRAVACLEALWALAHGAESAPPAQTDGPLEAGEISSPHQCFNFFFKEFPTDFCYYCLLVFLNRSLLVWHQSWISTMLAHFRN